MAPASRRPAASLLATGSILVLLALLLLASFPALPLRVAPSPPGLPEAASGGAPASTGTWLPNPRSYSALGDSITTAYDANGTLLDLGEQPYYSYAVGWNTSVLSFEQRLERIYGPGSVSAHLLAVPGDKAHDMIDQSLEAVANKSGFVTILIGGNDVCASSGGTPEPTTVDNFSQSLNHSLRILENGLPPTTVISLADVVNVTLLWGLFGGDTQAQDVWDSTCPALLTASGRSMMEYMIKAYNHIEEKIVENATAHGVDLTLWDIGNLTFSAADVNQLDYFHPTPYGHQIIAALWWSVLPYATMFPRFTSSPALPTSVYVATPLTVQFGIQDVAGLTLTATYKETGAFFWSTVPVTNLSSGLYYNGTYSVRLPFNATSIVGTLQLYLTASDVAGYVAFLPGNAPAGVFQVLVNSTSSSGPPPLSPVAISPSSPSLAPGAATTLSARTTSGGTEPGGAAYAWSLSPQSVGQLIPENGGAQALFVAGEGAGNGTVSVQVSEGTSAYSSTAKVEVVVSPPSSAPSPPGSGPSPSAASGLVPDLGYLLVVGPVVFLVLMALGGLLLRRRYLGGRPPGTLGAASSGAQGSAAGDKGREEGEPKPPASAPATTPPATK